MNSLVPRTVLGRTLTVTPESRPAHRSKLPKCNSRGTLSPRVKVHHPDPRLYVTKTELARGDGVSLVDETNGRRTARRGKRSIERRLGEIGIAPRSKLINEHCGNGGQFESPRIASQSIRNGSHVKFSLTANLNFACDTRVHVRVRMCTLSLSFSFSLWRWVYARRLIGRGENSRSHAGNR